MSEDNEPSVVFRTSQPGEAETLAGWLNDAGIPSEIRLVVPASREADAIAIIEAYMKSIGAAPNEEPPATSETESLLPCLNCETPGIALHKPCRGCGFTIFKSGAPTPSVLEHAPGVKTFCPECRDPLTLAAGACPACSEELEPLEAADRLCPSREHVLYRDTVGGAVCKACKRVWVDLDPA